MPQCREMIGNRRCKVSCVKGTNYCLFHSKKNSNSVVPRIEERNELSSTDKFLIRQAANRTAKIAGDFIVAKGVETLLSPQTQVTTVIEGRYVPQSTITANEAALSKSKRAADLRSGQRSHIKLTVKGSPGKNKRYRSTTKFVRADRTWSGKVRVHSKGRDFLHSIEDSKESQTRLAKTRNRARLTIIGGTALRFGVPVIMTAWAVSDFLNRDGDFYLQKDAEAMYGRHLGAGMSYATDTLFWGGLEELSTQSESGSDFNVLPPFMYF